MKPKVLPWWRTPENPFHASATDDLLNAHWGGGTKRSSPCSFPEAVQHLLVLICLSRAGMENCNQPAGAMVPEVLGA
ncbi:rCG61908, isoform CRA_a [Rattus norvegicus]|uniref:RCG61908, isoform CRA_a n=1 Tax=Rattus norvegicus TaxID=10116 RepID=A6HCI3_RAT|nr:rCG61908, isoform CRA_a [Rattus norvegicus]